MGYCFLNGCVLVRKPINGCVGEGGNVIEGFEYQYVSFRVQIYHAVGMMKNLHSQINTVL